MMNNGDIDVDIFSFTDDDDVMALVSVSDDSNHESDDSFVDFCGSLTSKDEIREGNTGITDTGIPEYRTILVRY
jgi:hypothetical protein